MCEALPSSKRGERDDLPPGALFVCVVDEGLEVGHGIGHGSPEPGANANRLQIENLLALGERQRELALTAPYIGDLRVVHDGHDELVDRGIFVLSSGETREVPQIDNRTTGNAELRRVADRGFQLDLGASQTLPGGGRGGSETRARRDLCGCRARSRERASLVHLSEALREA